MNKNKLIAAIAMFSFLVIGAQSIFGASTTVLVGSGGLKFVPATVDINAGDSVIWSWAGSNHSTTSGTNGVPGDDNGVLPNGMWDSKVNNTGFLFTNTFPVGGTYSYYCSVHFGAGMTGDVVVASASLPPSITITNPFTGEVFAAPANVEIQSKVTAGSAAITSVQFRVGTTVLANETAGPFATTANSLAAGNYTLTAIAVDANDLSATNSVAISVVNPLTLLLGGLSKPSGTGFQLSYPANIGLHYVVQRSSDFIGWVPLATNMASSNPVVFMDFNATNRLNFYRVGLLPNP
jgi:plastocyanin